MFADRAELFKGRSTTGVLVCLLALATLLLAGCGDDGAGGAPETSGSTTSSPKDGQDPAEADTADADPDDLQVIEDWSEALTRGDVEAAAGYFATPSTAENGLLFKIESLDDAITFNESLPCGAEVISARTQGDLTSATFRLTDRSGGDCGQGVGGAASTSFEIVDGEIVEWRRIDGPPQPPGDRGSQSAPV